MNRKFEINAGTGILTGAGSRRAIPTVIAEKGMVVEVASADFIGAIKTITTKDVTLTDRRGRTRTFRLGPGAFFVDDQRVDLRPPQPDAVARPTVTNSGSVAVATDARIARASRILVEGVHDAALVEQVWGDDLRVEGVVVEPLHGADDLGAIIDAFAPSVESRLGVLLDHLVDGSKEARIADQIADPNVLITGHAYVDIWEAVRPEVVGIDAWPQVPKNEAWKAGVARRLGYTDEHQLWRHIRRSVRTWRDLDQQLIRAVEQLIDFVTVDLPA